MPQTENNNEPINRPTKSPLAVDEDDDDDIIPSFLRNRGSF